MLDRIPLTSQEASHVANQRALGVSEPDIYQHLLWNREEAAERRLRHFLRGEMRALQGSLWVLLFLQLLILWKISS